MVDRVLNLGYINNVIQQEIFDNPDLFFTYDNNNFDGFFYNFKQYEGNNNLTVQEILNS